MSDLKKAIDCYQELKESDDVETCNIMVQNVDSPAFKLTPSEYDMLWAQRSRKFKEMTSTCMPKCSEDLSDDSESIEIDFGLKDFENEPIADESKLLCAGDYLTGLVHLKHGARTLHAFEKL